MKPWIDCAEKGQTNPRKAEPGHPGHRADRHNLGQQCRQGGRGAAIIVDCMDNFTTRFILNEVAIRKGIPLVHASVWGLEGRLSFVQSPETPCLRCIFPEAPPSEVFPVLGATPGVIGTLPAVEAIKYLAVIGTNLKGKLLRWDGAKMEFLTLKAAKDPHCPGGFQSVSTPGGPENSRLAAEWHFIHYRIVDPCVINLLDQGLCLIEDAKEPIS